MFSPRYVYNQDEICLVLPGLDSNSKFYFRFLSQNNSFRRSPSSHDMAPPMDVSSTSSVTAGAETLRLSLNARETRYGDFRDGLAKEGFVVVKGAAPHGRADACGKKFHSNECRS
jgi:hypothetical protein